VLSQFLIPFLYVPKGGFPTDVINQQCTHSSSVIRIGDCFVPFLARSVPYLNFYYLVVYLDRTSCKLNSDCGFWVLSEFVFSVPWKNVRFTHSGVSYWLKESSLTNQNYFKSLVILLFHTCF
jgi:hypothetical protein